MLRTMMEKMRDIIDVKPKADDAVADDISELKADDTTPAEELNAEIGGDGAIPAEELTRITSDVVKGLKSVYDPEIPVDVYELGLIYKVDLSDERLLTIDMTLTAPGCPVAGEMPGWVEGAVRGIDGVYDVKVNMVFEPMWTPERMSDEAKLELGYL
jgi:FeS assembly SUF system protein